MTLFSRSGIVTDVLLALVVLTTVAGVSKGIATPAEPPAAGLPADAMQWPENVEHDARLAPGVAPRTAAQLHAAIRATDFTCDRVSGARVNGFTGGFTVDCNHDAFSYEVWNRDGEWTAEPQR
jgi:hypothetical protein